MLANCDAQPTTEAMDGAASDGNYRDMVWLDKNRFEDAPLQPWTALRAMAYWTLSSSFTSVAVKGAPPRR